MSPQDDHRAFQDAVLPHLDAAYTLARWITRRPQDAEDVVQEALVRALKYFSGYRGGNARAWFLTIVRNTSFTWLQRHRSPEIQTDSEERMAERPDENSNPEAVMLQGASRQKVRLAVGELPLEFREVVILRELEGLDYKEIAAVVGVPIGTVMSRLARGRARLQESLGEMRSSL
jgi:RNA polymerase sigma-70 factor (ECF subfamily)